VLIINSLCLSIKNNRQKLFFSCSFVNKKHKLFTNLKEFRKTKNNSSIFTMCDYDFQVPEKSEEFEFIFVISMRWKERGRKENYRD